jgi:hypothetical protein
MTARCWSATGPSTCSTRAIRTPSPACEASRRPPTAARRRPRAAAAGCSDWRWHTDNPQDRGILRTGRHEGDWELVQVRVDAAGKPAEAVYAQHSGGERCGWASVRRRDDAPVAFLANGSHAAYFRPGLRDRTFPDPNDEAEGHGRIQRARLVPVNERAPGWMRFSGRWGGSRARLPFESSSPRGPAFQGERWDDPGAFAAHARPCTGGRCDERGESDDRERALGGGVAGVLGLLAAGLFGLRRRRSRPAEADGRQPL